MRPFITLWVAVITFLWEEEIRCEKVKNILFFCFVNSHGLRYGMSINKRRHLSLSLSLSLPLSLSSSIPLSISHCYFLITPFPPFLSFPLSLSFHYSPISFSITIHDYSYRSLLSHSRCKIILSSIHESIDLSIHLPIHLPHMFLKKNLSTLSSYRQFTDSSTVVLIRRHSTIHSEVLKSIYRMNSFPQNVGLNIPLFI